MRKIILLLCVVFISSGLVSAKYIAYSNPKTAVTIEAACLHIEPDNDSDLAMCFPEGAELTVVGKVDKKEKVEGKSGYWYKVSIAEGVEYYVHGSFIKFEK